MRLSLFAPDRCQRSRPCAAFTLVELLVVMAIILLIGSITVPAVTSTLRGMQVNEAGRLVTEQIALARQVAVSHNHSVEVRFYQYGDTGQGENASKPASGKFRALQLFEVPDGGTQIPASGTVTSVPLGKVVRLPSAVIIDSGTTDPNATLSSILSGATATASPVLTSGTALGLALPGLLPSGNTLSYNAVSFWFLPGGSTNLPSTTQVWFLTLHSILYGDALSTAPANFFTIQINADNGHSDVTRP